jgi:DNA-3-methyladenine glycosylase I
LNQSADRQRCEWVAGAEPLYVAYHDLEWGVPSHDDTHLLEMLILEGAQAGLSWSTILRKREGYRNALAGFDAKRLAAFDESDVERLMLDPGIVRNRAKIYAAIANAQATLAARKEFGSLDAYLWSFVNGAVIQNHWQSLSEMAPTSPQSIAMSKDLKKRGFKFVGPTTCYAFMEAAGLVNDHTVSCFRYEVVAALA